jgi:hypothetical protein
MGLEVVAGEEEKWNRREEWYLKEIGNHLWSWMGVWKELSDTGSNIFRTIPHKRMLQWAHQFSPDLAPLALRS